MPTGDMDRKQQSRSVRAGNFPSTALISPGSMQRQHRHGYERAREEPGIDEMVHPVFSSTYPVIGFLSTGSPRSIVSLAQVSQGDRLHLRRHSSGRKGATVCTTRPYNFEFRDGKLVASEGLFGAICIKMSLRVIRRGAELRDAAILCGQMSCFLGLRAQLLAVRLYQLASLCTPTW
jgi:hypothetical protein